MRWCSQWLSTLGSQDNHQENIQTCSPLGPTPRASELDGLGQGSRCSYFINITSQVIIIHIRHWEPLYCTCCLNSPTYCGPTFRAIIYHCWDSYCGPLLSCLWHDWRNLGKLFISTNSFSTQTCKCLWYATSCPDSLREIIHCALAFLHSFVQGQVFGNRLGYAVQQR